MKQLMAALWSMTLLLVLICSATSSAQQTTGAIKGAGSPAKTAATTAAKPSSLRPAKVSGYVFAVTKGGDLKPARLAKVYLFYSRTLGQSAERVVDKSGDSAFAADVFQAEVLHGLDQARAWEADKPDLQDSTKCNNRLLRGYDGAIVRTIEWGSEHKTQIVFGNTDEEGKFEIAVPPPTEAVSFENGVPHGHAFAPGVYLVVVNGTAGYNNAIWESEVEIRPGETAKLKISNPTVACLKMDSE